MDKSRHWNICLTADKCQIACGCAATVLPACFAGTRLALMVAAVKERIPTEASVDKAKLYSLEAQLALDGWLLRM